MHPLLPKRQVDRCAREHSFEEVDATVGGILTFGPPMPEPRERSYADDD